MSTYLFESDAIIHDEMLSHVPLFIHRKPEHVAILIDMNQGIITEVVKHACVSRVILVQDQTNLAELKDARIQYPNQLPNEKDSLDIIINGTSHFPNNIADYFLCLKMEGLFIQLCESPFDLEQLKTAQRKIQMAGFSDILPLQFSQPNFTSGWRAAILACKHGTIKRPREKDIFNKAFATRYYNLDMHRAAFAMPEFMRSELAMTE
jgi:spermidine synthase